MSVSLEKQIKDRHGYVAVFLYVIYQGPSFLSDLVCGVAAKDSGW